MIRNDSSVLLNLTIREYFAGLAMQNLQNVLIRKSGQALVIKLAEVHNSDSLTEIIAIEAVRQADELIKQLNKEVK